MLPGSHRSRITYGPGFSGSPKRTAVSLVPAAFLTHLMFSGVMNSTALLSICAAEPVMAASIMLQRVRAAARVTLVMVPPQPTNGGPPEGGHYVQVVAGSGTDRRFAARRRAKRSRIASMYT